MVTRNIPTKGINEKPLKNRKNDRKTAEAWIIEIVWLWAETSVRTSANCLVEP